MGKTFNLTEEDFGIKGNPSTGETKHTSRKLIISFNNTFMKAFAYYSGQRINEDMTKFKGFSSIKQYLQL